MIAADDINEGKIGTLYLEALGDLKGIFRRSMVEFSGDGYRANCYPDHASISHVLRRKGEFGDFLEGVASGWTEILISAPLVSSAEYSQGYRSFCHLWGKAKEGQVEMGIDYIPQSHQVLHRIFTLLLQGRIMKRTGFDTPEGNMRRVSEACGIQFKDGRYVAGIEHLPHIIDVFLGEKGGFQSGDDGNDPTGLYSFGVEIKNNWSSGKFSFEDTGYDGGYDTSLVTLETNAKYQTRRYLDWISGFVVP